MARKWEMGIGRMEEALIEVFGCTSLKDRVITLDATKKSVMSGFYLDAMEERLVEVFGCISLNDRVIRLDASRDRKRMEKEFALGSNFTNAMEMQLPANA